MINVNKNERSWAISLISDINIILENKNWIIKRAGGETTINTGKSRMFPDVILYGDKEQRKILQGWELKMPDVPIDDNEFVADAKRKANILGLNSCLIFNFTYAVLFIKDETTGDFIITKKWDETRYIKSREDVYIYKDEWIKLIEKILLDINEYFVTGIFKTNIIGEVISNNLMAEIINDNQSLVAEELKRQSINNLQIRYYIESWWEEVKQEYLKEEKNEYMAYARIILLNWINKVIFAHIIKFNHNPAKLIESIDKETSVLDGIKIFNRITSKCDFFNIFSYIKYSEFLPEITWNTIKEFNTFLSNSGILDIDINNWHNILENTINSSHRAIIGQYTTPQKLAEILVRISLKSLHDVCIDPCCGTGTIPNEIIRYKSRDLPIKECYATTYLSDKQSFPLQIANISLTLPESINIPARIFSRDVFELEIGNNIDIVNPENGQIIHDKVQEFDSIISNLPFIDFCRNNYYKDEREKIVNEICKKVKDETGLNLSNRCDMYVYIILEVWKLLKNGGNLCVITSNSWLGTDAGRQFYKVVKHYYNIKGVFISGKERWFKNAKIVTTIILLEKKKINENSTNTTSFNIINKTLLELNDESILRRLVYYNSQKQSKDEQIIKINNYTQDQIEDILSMNVSINSLFYNVDWLLELKHILCPINKYFIPFRGERTGQDDIFYLDNISEVDENYVDVALKNTRNCKELNAVADSYIFNCDKTLKELEELGHKRTIDYIKRNEAFLNQSVKIKKDKWYMLNIKNKPLLFTGMNPGERLFYGRFTKPTIINQRLIGLMQRNEKIDLDLIHALLNSMIGMFYIEAVGFGRGEGVLDISKDNLGKGYMLNPEKISNEHRKEIIDAFEKLKSRDIKSLREELEEKDRIYFEHCVLSAFKIDNYYDRIKDTIINMQKNRIDNVK